MAELADVSMGIIMCWRLAWLARSIVLGEVCGQAELPLDTKARIAFSAVHGLLPANILAEWILANRLWNVTLNVQIHKLIQMP